MYNLMSCIIIVHEAEMLSTAVVMQDMQTFLFIYNIKEL